MSSTEKEIVPGLTTDEVRIIAEQIFNRRDENHPQINSSETGFINLLQNGKPELSASSIFIKKVNL